jgi:hypothetical protein
VGGIGPEFQESMAEMLDAVQNKQNCLVLFPVDNFGKLKASHLEDNSGISSSTSDEQRDVIVKANGENRNIGKQNSGGHCSNHIFVKSRHGLWSIKTSNE